MRKLSNIPLYLFAKAPVAGKVKTRMCPPLNHEQAADVAAVLLAHAIEQVDNGWLGQCVLWAAPDLSHPDFTSVQKNTDWQVGIQTGVELGERMQNALQAGINDNGAAAVLGTDIPALNADILGAAHTALANGMNVIGPSKDGGFYFLGLQSIPESLFQGIIWGTDSVYAKLMKNAQTLGIQFEILSELSDCDDFEDLQMAILEVPNFSIQLKGADLDIT